MHTGNPAESDVFQQDSCILKSHAQAKEALQYIFDHICK